MAQTIATAYVDIMPSTRGLKAALDKEVTPAAKAAGTTAGRSMGDALSTEVQRTAGPRLRKVMADAAAQGKVGFTTKIKGIGASLVDEFKATGRISETLGVVRQNLALTGSDARGLTEKFKTVSGASGGLATGLGGVSSLLMGPWGLAIAGAGLALNGFQQAQENADAAAKALLDTLDQQTGAYTKASAAQVVTALLKDLDKAGDVEKLKAIGVNLDEAAVAALQGGPALEAYQAKLEALYRSFSNNKKAGNGTTQAIKGLQSSLINQREDLDRTRGQWNQYALGLDLTNKAAAALGIKVDETTGSTQQLGGALKALPRKVGITIDGNLANAANQAVILANALAAVGGSSNGQSTAARAARDYADGLRSGRYKPPKTPKPPKVKVSGSSSGGSSRTSSGSNPLAAARSALRASVAGSFATDLAKEDAAGIQRITLGLIKGTRAALNGSKESALVALLKRDNVKLKGLAAQRASVQKELDKRESELAGLTSQKASTVSSTASAALGNLTGARSASGIKRVLTRQLAQVKAFRTNLVALAKRGLPQVFLEQLVAAGLDGAATAAALARSNDADFASIRGLTNSLATESSGLGKDAGSILYDTGIATAQGLIDGLKSQDSAIEAQLLSTAKLMQRAIRKALGIKSPSKVFEELGAYTGQGFAKGIDGQADNVSRSIVGMVRIPQQRASLATVGAGRGGDTHHWHVAGSADPNETAAAAVNAMMWRAKR